MSRRARPKRRLGQHFLRDQATLKTLTDLIRPAPGQHFVELGAGEGTLTAHLLRAGARVSAIEVDTRLCRVLHKRFEATGAAEPQFRLYEGDMRKLDWRQLAGSDPCRLVGNLPYQISSLVLTRLLTEPLRWQDAHFLVQREMAMRATARPGSRHWGRLGVLVHCTARAGSLLELPPQAFEPPPKVHSSLLRLEPLRKKAVSTHDRPWIEAAARLVFSGRRKSLRNSLKGHFADEELRQIGLDMQMRSENIAFADLCLLGMKLKDRQQA